MSNPDVGAIRLTGIAIGLSINAADWVVDCKTGTPLRPALSFIVNAYIGTARFAGIAIGLTINTTNRGIDARTRTALSLTFTTVCDVNVSTPSLTCIAVGLTVLAAHRCVVSRTNAGLFWLSATTAAVVGKVLVSFRAHKGDDSTFIGIVAYII